MDTRTPIISVIMPTYKHEMFIRRAISSLLEQSFTNWELIVINDDSPDKTEEVMQEYLKDERIRYYRNKYNKGLVACLNFGLSIALAPYIAYLPSDDVIYKNHLQTLYSNILHSHHTKHDKPAKEKKHTCTHNFKNLLFLPFPMQKY